MDQDLRAIFFFQGCDEREAERSSGTFDLGGNLEALYGVLGGLCQLFLREGTLERGNSSAVGTEYLL